MRFPQIVFLAFLLKGIVAAPSAAPAEPCDPLNCVGNCRCWDSPPPGNSDFEPIRTPQIVFLTFDESVTVSNYPYFQQLLAGRTNPNGCPIAMTFFVNHDYSDYSIVNDLYKQGNEIALHSVSSGSALVEYWQNADESVWLKELNGLKTIFSDFANVPTDAVKGARAPYLEPGGDAMVSAMAAAGVEYDFSYLTREFVDPPLWPYTLDYASGQDCLKANCISESHPGFWSVPIVPLFLNESVFCAIADQCGSIPTREEQFDFFMSNFNRGYNSNRAPFSISARGSYFVGAPQVIEGYFDFLDEILSYGDVYVVTVKDGIEWMKNPTSLDDIVNFTPWQCPAITTSCDTKTCFYPDVTPGGARYMSNCAETCPLCYPWVNNPSGEESEPGVCLSI